MPVKWYTVLERLWQERAGSDTVVAAQPGDCFVRGGDRETVIVSMTPAEGTYICDFGAFSSKSYKCPY
jgi:hypothetical protein